MLLKSSLVLIFINLFLSACKLIQPVEINNSEFEKISIKVSIKIDYKPIFSEENIEDQLKILL